MACMSPIVNINGTSKEELIQQRSKAMLAVRQAMEVLSQLRPHGRDYCGDSQRYNADVQVHVLRFRALQDIHNDLEQEALTIEGL